MDIIRHRLDSWQFTLALTEIDHIGPQVAHNTHQHVEPAAGGVRLERNYVETAMKATATGPTGLSRDWFHQLSWL
jgi:hypothetical protein